MPRPVPEDWRRASGSLNKRSIRSTLFDAAARSADSFSSVAGRWSLSRRRRSRTASEHKARLRKRRSFAPPRPFDDGTPALHTNTPFVIATSADHQRALAAAASAAASASASASPRTPLPRPRVRSPRYDSFASETASAASLRAAAAPHRPLHPALRPTFDALRLLRKIPDVMAGWVHVRLPSSRLRFPSWAMFWAELRGGYLLLTRDHAAFSAVSDAPAHRPVDYIFGATHCAIARTPARSGAVKFRLRRASTRQPDLHAHLDAAELMMDPDDFRRMSERSNTKTSTMSDRCRRRTMGFGGKLASLAAKITAAARPASERDMSTATATATTSAPEEPADLILKIPSAPEADKWQWALKNATQAYESKPLADFQLINALGAGAFGRVYLVHDAVKDEYLALKVLDKSLVFRDRLHFESAVNERLTLELVKGKPFMAQLRYAFQTPSCLYLVTDFYEGGDLFSFLRANHEHVKESQAIRIIAEVVVALQSMHEMGIVYRDLKPENVLLDGDGHVRLADLGLAKLLDRDNDYLTSTICGSLSYAAPEMLSEKQYGIAFDMWTLGVFIYLVLTGDMPYDTEGRSRQEILEDQRKAEIPRKALSKDGHALVKALLRPNPLRRPTCQDLRKFRIFAGVDWDELIHKVPHKNSVKNVMDKIATKARQSELNTMQGDKIGGESDVFLLRNFDPEEWSDMTFSDISDGASTANLFRPDLTESDDLPGMTRMVPGWSLSTDNAVAAVVKPQLAVSSPPMPMPMPMPPPPLGRRATSRIAKSIGVADMGFER